MSTSDQTLLRLWAAERNADAFAEIVSRHSTMVFNACKRILRDSMAAEEVTQEAFLELAEKGTAVRSSLGGWLHTVATHRALDRVKRENRRKFRETQFAASLDSSEGPAWTEIWEHVDAAIAQLPDELKGPIVQRFLEGQSQEAVAMAFGVSPSTVRFRINKGIDQIRRHLKRSGLAAPVALLAAALEAGTADAVPSTLTATLGKVALAGVARPTAGVVSHLAAYGGTALVKTKVLAGATVILLLAGGLYCGWQRWSRPYTPKDITSASQFSVKGLPSAQERQDSVKGARAERHISAQRAVQKPETDTTSATESREAIKVPAAYGILRGLVLTQDRVPVPNVRVVLSCDGTGSSSEMLSAFGSDTEPATISDRGGRFEFDDIPLSLTDVDGVLRYVVRGEIEGLFGVAVFIGDQTLRDRYVELILEKGVGLGGTVVDAGGKPVADASLQICGSMQARVCLFDSRVESDKDGRFRFRQMTPGKYKIHVHAKGFLDQRSGWLASGTDNAVIRLERGLGISGRVVDAATGEAITGCSIRATSSDKRMPVCVALDVDGRFAISGLVPGAYPLQLASALASEGSIAVPWIQMNPDERDGAPPSRGRATIPCSYALVEPVSVELKAGNTVSGLELKATKGCGVVGRVLDAATNMPVANAHVEALMGGNEPGWEGLCEPSGSFSIEGLPPGEYSIKATSPDYRDASISLTLAAGEVKQDLVLRIEHWPGLTGIVLDTTGKPYKGAAVFAVAAEDVTRQASTISDESGRFGLYFPTTPPWEKGPPRRVYVQALSELGMSPLFGPVSLRDPGEVVLRLAESGRIEGEVVDTAGQPLPDACVTAVPDDETTLNITSNFLAAGSRTLSEDLKDTRVMTGFSGTYVFPSLLPGRYTLNVYLAASPPKLPVAETEVTVGAGQDLYARLVVDTGVFGAIEGRVTTNGEPFTGQRVFAKPESGEWTDGSVEAWTDEDGHYRLENILSGSVTVRLCYIPLADGAGQMYQTQTAEVAQGETSTLDFDVPSNLATVEGVVRNSGVPETNALLIFNQEASTEPAGTAMVDAQGHYKISLLEGTYSIDVYRSNMHAKGYATVQAVANQTTQFDIDFAGGIIEGTLSGLDPGEVGFVALLPGDVNVPQWTLEAIQALAPLIIRSEQVPGNGPFRLADVEPGVYVLGAAAMPRDAPVDPASLLDAKLALVPIEVKPGESVSVELQVE